RGGSGERRQLALGLHPCLRVVRSLKCRAPLAPKIARGDSTRERPEGATLGAASNRRRRRLAANGIAAALSATWPSFPIVPVRSETTLTLHLRLSRNEGAAKWRQPVPSWSGACGRCR